MPKKLEMPSVGDMLRKYVKKHRLSQSGWGRQASLNRKTIASYLKNPDMHIGTLWNISQELGYNFVQEIANQLPPELPPHPENPLAARVAELEEENKLLRKEVETLKEAIGLMGRK